MTLHIYLQGQLRPLVSIRAKREVLEETVRNIIRDGGFWHKNIFIPYHRVHSCTIDEGDYGEKP